MYDTNGIQSSTQEQKFNSNDFFSKYSVSLRISFNCKWKENQNINGLKKINVYFSPTLMKSRVSSPGQYAMDERPSGLSFCSITLSPCWPCTRSRKTSHTSAITSTHQPEQKEEGPRGRHALLLYNGHLQSWKISRYPTVQGASRLQGPLIHPTNI